MPDQLQLAETIWNLFSANRPALREAYRQKHPGSDLVHFSPFKKAHADLAGNYYQRFSEIAASGPDEAAGIEKTITAFLDWRKEESPDLLYYSYQSFLTNYEGKLAFVIPPLVIREPELSIPSQANRDTSEREIAVGSPKETKMDWFREDPSLNEHHGHWHIVYSNRVFKDRQGEMFFYMHQQMLARYDADRLSSGIERVQPFDDMKEQNISVGYAAGEDVRLSNLISGGRRPRAVIDEGEAAEQLQHLSDIRADIDGGYYQPNDTQSSEEEIRIINRLGATLEANPQADGSRPYVNYHGNGHVKIGSLNNGVMFYTEAAIRDVVFWEWHKGVDDLYFRLQESLPPSNFSTDAPKVKLRKRVLPSGEIYSPDLIFCTGTDLPEDGTGLAESLFGGSAWETDFKQADLAWNHDGQTTNLKTVNTLHTEMRSGVIKYRDGNNERSYNFPYLFHESFAYCIRVENPDLQSKFLTIRIFMAPDATADDRRSWIEMDKFSHEVAGNSKAVIFRRDLQASVVRKPAVTDPANYNLHFDPARIPIDDRQCSCGWPYHMLLPKGNSSDTGMAFRVMVMITDGTRDGLAEENDCGSISFCGARNNRYPDRRPLGYPFNRKFEGNGKGIEKAILAQDHMLCRTIFIKHKTS